MMMMMSSKDNDNKRLMQSKSDNIEIMIGNETGEIIKDLFHSLLYNYGRNINERQQFCL